ncbi:leucine-rich repeat and IQ domain-containing protein 1 [Lingula anatina]|uniref:Leucine-rich repeat and IQ domain-containing protein 1 n=1 Tax=Lingula anatina TaxID=7574 RepID=A0A1S3J000_LINAN|nr:leucine-rich repeat and IQ domain-containing protein 1 [Lingula anatina]|eukprot:XP_013403129.1 leucine-rich repeat and IQ domain-containing protein 1 [Lingula anatina]
MSSEEEEALIEAEIQKQLDLIDEFEANETIEDGGIEEDITIAGDEVEQKRRPELEAPESRLDFFTITSEVEKELEECDEILKEADEKKRDDFRGISVVLADLASEAGEDPEAFRQKMLKEIEEYEAQEVNGGMQQHFELKPEEAVVSLIYESDILESQLREQIREFEEKRIQQEEERKQIETKMKQEADRRMAQSDAQRKQKLEEIKKEEQLFQEKNVVKQAEVNSTVQMEQKKFEESMKKFEEELHELEVKTKEEQQELEHTQRLRAERIEQQRNKAAITLQAHFKGYRVKKEHASHLQHVKEERLKKKMEVRIKIVEEERKHREEVKKQEENEKIKKQQEEKELLEKKQREEQETKRKMMELEMKKKMEEEKQKQEEESKQQEERERKRKEEEEEAERLKKEEERQRQEEEKKRKEKEEQDRMRKEEEERLQREEKQRKEEEMRRKKEEEKQKQLQEEIRKKEEAKRKLEEENKRLEEEKIKKQLEEERRKAEEKKKLDEEELKRKKEAEQKKLEEDRKPKSPVLSLPPELEEQRLAWIQSSIPWSKVAGELKTKKVAAAKRAPRRPVSAKNLSLLGEDIILNAAKVNALAQVTTVVLKDLPGSVLNTLSQCPKLKALSMVNCGLVALDGLEDCKELQYIDCKSNELEMVNLKDLSNLLYLDISHNSLTSIHGLEGCSDLRYLNMSNNKITRIGGLGHLKRLHTLLLSHNQLISTRGLSEAPTIQCLDLSHNHLPTVEDHEKLCLLQSLNLKGNNILEVPSLSNHVLLYLLICEDNSIFSMNSLSECWLPLLRTLSLRQNSLGAIGSLNRCVTLTFFDASNNEILELNSFIPGLAECNMLTDLKMEGNPVTEETEVRSSLLSCLPRLQCLDGATVCSSMKCPPRTVFDIMCEAQVKRFSCLEDGYLKSLRSCHANFDKLIQTHREYFDASHQLAVDIRYCHEYGEVTLPSEPVLAQAEDKTLHNHNSTFNNAGEISPRDNATMHNGPSAPQPGYSVIQSKKSSDFKSNLVPSPPTSAKKTNVRPFSGKNKFEAALSKAQQGASGGNSDLKPGVSTDLQNVTHNQTYDHTVKASPHSVAELTTTQEACLTKKDDYALASGGGSFNRDEAVFKRKSLQEIAATKVQSLWRGYVVRRDIDNQVQFWLAATKIQALWRGYRTRKLLSNAINYARQDDSDEDFAEIDLSAFDYQEADLDAPWKPPDTPQLPGNHPVLGRPWSGLDPHPPPRQAWRSADSPSVAGEPQGKPPRPPSSSLSGAETHRTGMSKMSKKDELSEEWGFHDSRTAELMLQRAKKLKYNAEKRKKLNKLDPKQRLALFRKGDHHGVKTPVQKPVRPMVQRKEYFQAMHEEAARKEYEKQEENESKVQRTFEWLHTQVGEHDVSDSKIYKRPVRFGSEGNLPQLHQDVLSGGRVSLVASPASMELQSVRSASTTGDRTKSRRHSVEETSPRGGLELPAIKTSSAPSMRVKERISWRNPEVNKSSGWGSGKRRIIK